MAVGEEGGFNVEGRERGIGRVTWQWESMVMGMGLGLEVVVTGERRETELSHGGGCGCCHIFVCFNSNQEKSVTVIT